MTRGAHADEAWPELQIGICQQALDGLPQLKDISAKAKTEVRTRMEAEIERFRKSTTGIFGGAHVFSGERYNLFDAMRATGIRKKYQDARNRENIPRRK